MKQYLMGKIKKTKHTHAVFFNTIDTVARSEDEEFKIYGEMYDEKLDKTNSVRYSFNSLGFRSDEFTDVHNGEHILFSGCSEAEGVGDNIESCWPYMVYQKLSEAKHLSGFFNLSRSGWGHDVIIPNIIEYINTYGKPDKIYILFPNLSRDFEWKGVDSEEESYVYSTKTPYFLNKNIMLSDGTKREKQGLEEQRKLIVKFVVLVKLFEEYCMSNDIKLVWSTWSIMDGQNYEGLNVFKSFIEMSSTKEMILMADILIDKESNSKKNLLRKRDGHHGYFYHSMWAQKFLGWEDTYNTKIIG